MSSIECSDCKGLKENCDTCHGLVYHIRQQEEQELGKNIEFAKILFFPGCGPSAAKKSETTVDTKVDTKVRPIPKETSLPTTPFEGWTITDFQRRVNSLPINMHWDKDTKLSKEEAFNQLLLRLVGITGLLANTLTSPILSFSPDTLEVFVTELVIISVMLTNNIESPIDLQKAIEDRFAELKKV